MTAHAGTCLLARDMLCNPVHLSAFRLPAGLDGLSLTDSMAGSPNVWAWQPGRSASRPLAVSA